MSYGVEVYNSSGQSIFDTDSQSFTLYTTFLTPHNTNGSQSFPELAGKTIYIQDAWDVTESYIGGYGAYAYVYGSPLIYSAYTFSISYASGYPVVSWSKGSVPSYVVAVATRVFVFVSDISSTSGYGIYSKNNSNELILSDFTTNYEYIGHPTFIQEFQFKNAVTGVPYMDKFFYADINSSTIPIPFIQDIAGQYATVLRIYTSGSYHRLEIGYRGSTRPAVYCFAQKTTPSSGYGLQVYSSSGSLLTDSGSNILNGKSYSNYVAAPATISGGDAYWTINSTSLLTTNGSLPTNSASFCTNNMFVNRNIYWNSDNWSKGFYSGVTKSGGNLYSCWICRWVGFAGGAVTTSITLNTSQAFRVYSINTDQYP